LGLALVASVAKVHGGALELGDNNPGLRANMVIAAQTAGALQPVVGDAGLAASVNRGDVGDAENSETAGGHADAAAQVDAAPGRGDAASGADAAAAQSLRIRSVS
jgi:hypothetical protein